MDKNIIRRSKNKKYTVICNEIYNDKRLDMKARGIHTYVLTKPDNWRVVVADIIKSGLDGERAIRSGINLLVELHYWQRYRVYDDKNRVICGETIVYETPYTDQEKIKRAKLSKDGKQITYFYEDGTEETIDNDQDTIDRYRERKLESEEHKSEESKNSKSKHPDKGDKPTENRGRKKTSAIVEAEDSIKDQIEYDDILNESMEIAAETDDDISNNEYLQFVNQTVTAAAALITDDNTQVKGKPVSRDLCRTLVSNLNRDLVTEFWEEMRPKFQKAEIKNVHGFLKSCLYTFLSDYPMKRYNMKNLDPTNDRES